MNRENNSTLTSVQKTYWQNERGAAMLLSIMLMVVLSLLTITLFELLTASTQITGNHRLEIRTLYVADAGVEAAINKLRDNPDWSDGFTDEFPIGTGNKYTVGVVDVPPTNLAIYAEKDITSVGTIGGFDRTILVHVKIIWIGRSDPPEYSVATTSWRLV